MSYISKNDRDRKGRARASSEFGSADFRREEKNLKLSNINN